MPKPHFVFTSFHSSFNVKIPNLESLNVPQIQEIESFVSKRKGIFNFEKYSFSIQKKIEFFEFVKLLESVNIDATYEEKIVYKAAAKRVSFGEYRGLHYSQLPDSYLSWIRVNYRGKDRELVDAEILRRGGA